MPSSTSARRSSSLKRHAPEADHRMRAAAGRGDAELGTRLPPRRVKAVDEVGRQERAVAGDAGDPARFRPVSRPPSRARRARRRAGRDCPSTVSATTGRPSPAKRAGIAIGVEDEAAALRRRAARRRGRGWCARRRGASACRRRPCAAPAPRPARRRASASRSVVMAGSLAPCPRRFLLDRSRASWSKTMRSWPDSAMNRFPRARPTSVRPACLRQARRPRR